MFHSSRSINLGEPSKKPDPKAGVVVPIAAAAKLLKKGKRDAEEVIQKPVSKKQQKDVVANEVERKKIELKTEKKIVEKHESNEQNAINVLEFRIFKKEVMPLAHLSVNMLTKTLFMGNLSNSVHYAAVEEFFKDCGEIVDVRLALNSAGYFEGFGYVKFATVDVAKKALEEKDSKKLLGHAVRLDLVTGWWGNVDMTKMADAFVPVTTGGESLKKGWTHLACKRDAKEVIEKEVGNDESSSPDFEEELNVDEFSMFRAKANHGKLGLSSEKKGAMTPVPQPRMLGSRTLFMRNLSYAVDNEIVNAFFRDCGKVIGVRFALHSDGYHLGQCYVKFKTVEAAQKALEEKNCQDLFGRDVRLSFAVKIRKHMQHIAEQKADTILYSGSSTSFSGLSQIRYTNNRCSFPYTSYLV